jgi:hypothetical protein
MRVTEHARFIFFLIGFFCGKTFDLHLAVVYKEKSILNESQACSEL